MNTAAVSIRQRDQVSLKLPAESAGHVLDALAPRTPQHQPHLDVPADLDEPIIELPQEPQMERATGFPTMMVIAPVLVAGVMYAILQSPYVLVFAIFGPVFGIANLIDQRIGRRRRYQRALEQYDHDRAAAHKTIAEAHARVRTRARRLHPAAREVISGRQRASSRTMLGHSTVNSGLRSSGGDPLLQLDVTRIREMPFVVDATHLRVSGNSLHLQGFARAMVVQLLANDVGRSMYIAPGTLDGLREQLLSSGIALADSMAEAECSLVEDHDHNHADPDCIHVLILDDGSARFTDHEGNQLRIWPDTLAHIELIQWLPRLRRAQQRLHAAALQIPNHVLLRDLLDRATATSANDGDAMNARSRSLRADFLVGDNGVVSIDLVRDGAHALVAGTTGSGKSELLISWIASMCHNKRADELSFLGLDFKGGATFDVVATLPHCRGVVTDLDGDEAVRLAHSLTAEVRRREQVLREQQVRDISEIAVGTLERLLVVVDEYQALVQSHPQLQQIIADLAARGRSLGVHLVLCTQRPTGTFPEDLLANCAIRISLRVEQLSDSTTMLGCGDAAHISRERIGRALVRIGGGEVSAAQVAQTMQADILEIGRSKKQTAVTPASPIWYPPLSHNLPLRSLMSAHEHLKRSGASLLRFGRIDRPAEQAQPVATLTLGEHLYVVGRHGSGKTTTLRTIERAAVAAGWQSLVIPCNAELAWDLLQSLRERTGEKPLLVTIDNLDILESMFDDDHRAEWLNILQATVRMAAQRKCTFVLAAGRTTGTLSKLHQLCPRLLMLAMASRNDWLTQGGQLADFDASMPPGRGRLDGELMQVAVDTLTVSSEAREQPWEPWRIHAGVCVIARRTSVLVGWLEQHLRGISVVPPTAQSRAAQAGNLRPPEDHVVVGDIEQWISAYGAAAKFADTMPVVTIGCTASEWRSLFRGEPLPAFVANSTTTGLLRRPDGTFARIRLNDSGIPDAIAPLATLDDWVID